MRHPATASTSNVVLTLYSISKPLDDADKDSSAVVAAHVSSGIFTTRCRVSLSKTSNLEELRIGALQFETSLP